MVGLGYSAREPRAGINTQIFEYCAGSREETGKGSQKYSPTIAGFQLTPCSVMQLVVGIFPGSWAFFWVASFLAQ